MKTHAAVAFEAKRPLEIVELDLERPRAGEVLVEIKATGICHTDTYTLAGLDSEGLFPSVLGHEGCGVVQEVGAGVTSVAVGDCDPAVHARVPPCFKASTCAHAAARPARHTQRRQNDATPDPLTPMNESSRRLEQRMAGACV